MCRQKIVISPPIHKTFRCQKFSETPKGSPDKFIGTERQKKVSTENRDTPLLQKNIKIVAGIDVCTKPLKTRLKTIVSFAKFGQNICICAVLANCLVCYLVYWKDSLFRFDFF